jgi:hypothetical protein
MGRSVDEFYDHVKTASDAGRRLPNWCVVHFAYFLSLGWTDFACEKRHGELYLEVSHRAFSPPDMVDETRFVLVPSWDLYIAR